MTAPQTLEARKTVRQRALSWLPMAAQALWVALPLRVARWLPTVGAGLTDGLYLLRWPPLAVVGSPLALLLGLILGARHPGSAYTGHPVTAYTESLPLLLTLTAVGLGSAQLGMAALLGYAVGDFALHERLMFTLPFRLQRASPLEQFLRVQVPQLTSYYLLALLTVGVPLATVVARGQLRQVPLPGAARRILDPLLAGAGSAAVAGVLAYAWASAAPVLIRPVFTWAGRPPPPEAIQPLQTASIPFALGVAILAALRVLLERLATTPAIAQAATAVQAAMVQTIRSRRPGRLARNLGIAGGALGLTLLLAGMVSTLIEGALLFLFLAALLTLRDALQRLDWLPLRLLGRVPVLLRYGLGLFLAYNASRSIVGRNWRSEETFLPVLLATCASLLIITLLTLQPEGRPEPPNEPPPEAPGTQPEPDQEGPRRALPAGVAGGTVLLLALALDVRPAYAHNCGSLADCFQMLAIALAVVAAIALIVALVIATGGGGGVALAVAGGGSIAAGSAISATAVTAAQVAAASAVAAAAAQSLAMATAAEGGGGGEGGSGGNQQGGGGQGGEGARRAEEAVARARNDPAKQEHIFNNPRHDHQWGRTGQDMDGNWNLIKQTLEGNWSGIQGAGGAPFEVTRSFGNFSVTVRGRLVNGVIRIGTAFVN